MVSNKKHIQHLKVKLFIIIFILTTPLYSQDFEDDYENSLITSYSFNVLRIYNGFNITEDGASYELTGNLINLIIMNENTGIGFDISPMRYFYSYSTQPNIWSFVNIYLYWDIYRIIHPFKYEKFIIDSPEAGPFFSINWINIDDISPFNINKIIFSAGLKYSIGLRDFAQILWTNHAYFSSNNHTYLTIETGYKNIYGKHAFFLTVQLNLLDYLMVRLYSF